MKKNVAGQRVSAVVVSATDGSPITAGVAVTVTGDGGAQGAGGGAVTHEGGGEWSYAPTQAETNFDQIMFKFSAAGAISVGIQVYTQFPQTGDSFARLGAPAGASVSADVATVAGFVDTEVAAILAAVDTEVASIKAKTDQLTFTTANKVDSTIQAAGDFAQGAADKVWATAARSLTDKVGFALSAAGIQAIWDALTANLTTVGSIGKRLADNIDAAISSRSTYAGGDTAGTTTLLARLTAGRATLLDNLDAAITSVKALLPAALVGGRIDASVGNMQAAVITASAHAVGAIDALAVASDTSTEIADTLLDRDLGAGADTGSAIKRTVRQALRTLRNKTGIAGGTLTVTKEDDATASWTAAVTTAAGDPISSIDPA